jgi:hypothetical protein
MQASHSLLVLGAALVSLLAPAQALAAGEYCAPLPPAASVVDSDHSEDIQADGTKSWSSTVIYTLSTGETAEAVVTFDSRQTGEVYFAVDGEIVVYVTYAESDEPGANLSRGLATRSWAAPELAERQAMTAELLQESVGELLFTGLIPQATKCSDFGKGVMRGLKYLWIGATAAAGAACCAGTGIVGCAACAAGAAAAGTAGAEAANNHCD